jgi:hypothetical protein
LSWFSPWYKTSRGCRIDLTIQNQKPECKTTIKTKQHNQQKKQNEKPFQHYQNHDFLSSSSIKTKTKINKNEQK